jgi:hypothetical protein
MAGGILPFLMAEKIEKDPNSAQANAARAAAGNPLPTATAPGQVAVSGVTAQMPSYTVTTNAGAHSSSSQVEPSEEFNAAKADFTDAGRSQVAVADRDIERANQVNDSEIKRAESEQALLQKAAAQRAELEKQREAQRQQLLVNERSQQDAVDKASKPTGYWQDMTAPRRIIAAIALGAAAAVGAKEPFEVYQTYANEDRQIKMDRLKAETDKLLRMGKNREEVMAGYERQAAAIDRQEITNGKLLLKSAEIAARKLPGAALPAEKFKADLQADIAQKKIANEEKTLKKVESHSAQTTKSTTEGKPEAGGNAKPTESENNLTSRAGMIKDALDVLEPNVDIVPGVYSAMSSNVTQMEGNSETAKSGILGPWAVSKAREKGYLPASPLSGIGEKFGPKGEEVAAAGERANEAVMRHLSGGAITGNLTKGEEARARNGFSHVAGESIDHAKAVNANLRKLANTLDVLGGKATDALIARSMADIASGKEPSVLGQSTVGTTNQSVNKPAQPQAAAPAKLKSLTPSETEALQWAKENPGPEAKEIVRKIRAKRGQ